MINPVGRPLAFKTVEELSAKIQTYLDDCKSKDDVPTICGLAVDLDCDRHTLVNYERKEEYFTTVKRAKTIISAIQEQLALKGKINPTVWIFSAKNNLGYKDKQEVEQTGAMDNNLNISFK